MTRRTIGSSFDAGRDAKAGRSNAAIIDLEGNDSSQIGRKMASNKADPDLERLVEKCRRGDERSWDQLVERHKGLVYSSLRRMGLPEEDAVEVFGSTFTALYQNLDRIQNSAAIPRWLVSTATREALRISRSRSPAVVGSEPETLDEQIALDEKTVEDIVLEALWVEEVQLAVTRLGPKCRELIAALYFEDLSYKDASERLNIPLGGIGPSRARCLERLLQLLRK